SYVFTWQQDQNLLLRSSGLKDFIGSGQEVVANWAGRLGAWLSHVLVYRGFGLASLALGLWAISMGLHIINRKRMANSLRYLRWLCLILLVAAPILTFLFPNASFPWGGAYGSEAVAYSNGFLGAAGTGLVLLCLAGFVLFVIFALDISPMIRRARMAAQKMKEGLQNMRTEKQELAQDAEEAITTAIEDKDATVKNGSTLFIDDTLEQNKAGEKLPTIGEVDTSATSAKKYDLQLNEKEVPIGTIEAEPVAIDEEEYEPSDEELAYQEHLATKAIAQQNLSSLPIPTPEPEPAQTPQPATDELPKTEPGFSFEVVQQAEQPAAASIRHGDHISIESGEPYAPELDLPDYKFPTLDLLEQRSQETIALNKEELEQNKAQIEKTLNSFGITIQKISATVGPTVTLYEIIPAEGVRISKIRNLEDDIALNLAALGIRIIAPIPGKGTIGIEVPNASKQIVAMRTLLSSEKFVNNKMSLPIALGKLINNENYIVDLATMPHLLMAGATGQGKSVGINAILVSLLYKKHPSQLKFVMVDPKKVELSIYRTIEKHFLAKLPNEEEAIITDTKKVINTLNALCIEMDDRYELLKQAGARNIKEYNDKFIARKLNPEKGHKFLPFIVLVVDEFADLIMTAGKEVEMPIARLAQLARAIGIHLIVATQRPSVNVITGTIKANFPARIAFKVSAKVDSRTILDAGGAEQLIGRGDMLISHGSELLRIQCAFVDTPEVEAIVDFIGRQRGYPHAFELPEYEGDDSDGEAKSIDLGNRDKLFEECARIVVNSQSGSTSNLQRKMNLGYNRAGRIMDQLEAAGIVGPAVGSKPREVYFSTVHELEQMLDTL
ncbi:MAG: DNA translocase FtsK, partial [Bacteroidetes bacterium]|nr:DNA translocase FtsK [Bacteroidota bacterium]